MVVLIAGDDCRAERSREPQNLIAVDRLIAADAVRAAGEHGIRVIIVDGSADGDAVADLVAGHFAPFLPEPRRVSR